VYTVYSNTKYETQRKQFVAKPAFEKPANVEKLTGSPIPLHRERLYR